MVKHGVDFPTAKVTLAREAGLPQQKRILKTYDYTDESGNLLFQTVRYEPKDFNQRKPDGKESWLYTLQGIRLVPYNLPEVIKAKSIIIVEGEKDVETLRGIGLIASCNPMGAGKWRADYNPYFNGKKVVIIPDNDEPGKRHAETIAKNLKGIAESIKLVKLPGLPSKGDISDWIAQGHTKDELLELIKSSPEWEEPKEDPLFFLRKGSELLNLGCSIEWVTDKLIPKQSITLLHGKGGIGKTWLSLIIADSVSKGIPSIGLTTQQMPVIYIDFENSLPVLVDRVKKIHASEVLFWHNTNDIKPPKLDHLLWEQYKSLPIGLLIFDTLRASQAQDENDSRNMAFIMGRLKELRDQGFSIILLHHTPKSNDRTYKGSTAIMDLADHVLSLHKVRKRNLEDVADDEDEDDCYYKLGTKDKTRYEPFHVFLDFDPEKGFVIAPDPDEEDMKELHNIITALRDAIGELPIQSKIIDKAKEELELSKSKIARLLRKGEGKYWNSQKIPDRKNAKVFDPISVFEFSSTIYTGKLKNTPPEVSQFSNDTTPDSIPQTLDNTEFASFPEGIQKTEKQDRCQPCGKINSCLMSEGQKQLCGGPF
jgi:archaellum biogenesis ATPase FlaH/5S rRNA maturation endonuclease (ribonuclease M5)